MFFTLSAMAFSQLLHTLLTRIMVLKEKIEQFKSYPSGHGV